MAYPPYDLISMGALGAWDYTKGANKMIFNPPPIESWVLKKIYSGTNKLSQWVQNSNYNLQIVYSKIHRKDTKGILELFCLEQGLSPQSSFCSMACYTG